MRTTLILFAFGAVVFAQTPPPKTAEGPKGPATASASLLNPSAWTARAPESYKAKFTTTKGDFVIQVTRAWAPIGADRFYNLVKSGFFNDASFFRVVPNFMVQFGMPADPKVNAAWSRVTMKDDPRKQSNAQGTVTFAHTGAPNSRGTQVFINFRDNSFLDSQGFSPFGKVVEGFDVVQKLYSGYGDMRAMGGNGPDQGPIAQSGKAYLDKNFPKLDSIKSATIVE